MRIVRALVLTTDDPLLADRVETAARQHFSVIQIQRYPRSHKQFPLGYGPKWDGVDILLNVLSPIYIPGTVLAGLRNGGINVHPAPPEYPGVGGPSYALYRRDVEYGATAHVMTEKIDAGPIIDVRRCPIYPDDTCETLHQRGLDTAVSLFECLCPKIAAWASFLSKEQWRRKAYTREDFERFLEIPAGSSPELIARKVKACQHSKFPGPYLVTKECLGAVEEQPA